MKIWYESEDGILFDKEDDCYVHEQKQKHTHLNTIDFFDKENNRYTIGDNIFDDNVYYDAERIIIHNKDEYNDFTWLADECGWAEFNLINDVGEWVREEKSWDGKWNKK